MINSQHQGFIILITAKESHSISHGIKLNKLCPDMPPPHSDLQFSHPPPGGVLAKDEDELANFKMQLVSTNRSVSCDDLGDLCAQKLH